MFLIWCDISDEVGPASKRLQCDVNISIVKQSLDGRTLYKYNFNYENIIKKLIPHLPS